MRYDLVSVIDAVIDLEKSQRKFGDNKEDLEKKEIYELSDTQRRIIRLIQSNNLPELDGLRFHSIKGKQILLKNTNDRWFIIDFSESNTIYLKTCDTEDRVLFCIEYTILINNKEELSYSVSQQARNHFYKFTYGYDLDIIHIEKNKDEDKNRKGTITIYTNVYDRNNELEQFIEFDKYGVPKDLEPDIELFYTEAPEHVGKFYYGTGDDHYAYEYFEPEFNEILYRWRKKCNEISDNYHSKYEIKLKPKF